MKPANVAPRPPKRARVFSRQGPIREDVHPVSSCDVCGKTRTLSARRGMVMCGVCHATRRTVDGRYVWGPK